MKTVMAGMTLATILFIAAAADQANPSNENGTCIEHTKDVPAAQCICSMNCACAGRCIIEGGENPTSCFIDCVLKNDCLCPAGDAPELPTEEGDDGSIISRTTMNFSLQQQMLTMRVTRPKVSRSPEEKRRKEEVLLIKYDVHDKKDVDKFEVQVNNLHLGYISASHGMGLTTVIPLPSFLENKPGADGKNTIIVRMPKIIANVAIRDVRIIYQIRSDN